MLRLPPPTAISTVNIPCSTGAYRLNIEAWRWAAATRNDGRFDSLRVAYQLTRATEKTVRRHIEELFRLGIWIPLKPNGFVLPDFCKPNGPNWTRAQWEAYEKTQARNGRLGAEATWNLPPAGLQVIPGGSQ